MIGITYIENFVHVPVGLYNFLEKEVVWDERMTTRKTASFGEAYNYSQIDYQYSQFPKQLIPIIENIETEIGFKPNNCLINFYLDGKSKMGFHSDQTDVLEDSTGVVIISLGETRTLRFRRINNKEDIVDFSLVAGSLIYMTQKVQEEWQHAVPKSQAENGRMSLTFRKIKK